MKKLTLFLAVAVLLEFSSSTHANLLVVGIGDIVSGGSGSYQLIYDTELDLTWLDFTPPKEDWYDQRAWADALVVSFNGQIFDEWRLPEVNPVNGSAYVEEWRSDGSADFGFNISAPGSVYPGSVGSEMAHLFYTSLDNIGYHQLDGEPRSGESGVDWGLLNVGPFNNLLADHYWADTEWGSEPDRAWHFGFQSGGQGNDIKTDDGDEGHYGLAVISGNVAPVPEPSTILLLCFGLAGLVGIRRRFTQ